MPRFSRRSFLHLSAAVSAAAAFRVYSEPMLAAAARRRPIGTDAVLIDSNENPLGPSQGARDAIAQILPLTGRYNEDLTDDLVAAFAQQEGLNPEFVRAVAGSSPALGLTVATLTGPQKSYVTADPGYESGMAVATTVGARVVKVPLTKAHAHDVKAMLAAGPDAGLFYVCTPNNPTGTLTPHSDIEYLVENKPKDSFVLVDEAYIHFADSPSTIDLVKAGKDVIVLRTFSKVYGMAGLRCGLIIARPELLEKILRRGGWNAMPVTALAAAMASLKDPNLVAQRREINTRVRQQTFQWLDQNNYSYVPSVSNCFMLDTKRPGKEVREAMAKENVMVGRVWPSMPNCVRITVGTQDEMERFQAAFQKVMKA
ncbi:MAG TPA: pyridoxal phosphate-dependent aminotransferase [Candidatus Sulfotelmatobacter sp.]|nr:pyridoxal phosphate-dependent aminotransferase [Candidatus Sulfotelmatobacter sp.]